MTSPTARTVAVKRRPAARLGRADRSALGLWFWEIDRVLLLLVTILISIGLIAVAAAAPAAAARYSGGDIVISPLTYFWKQLFWVVLGLPVMIGISMLPTQVARRFAIGGAAFFSIMLAAVPLIGIEKNGAMRWIGVGIGQFQPSEFLKPLFVVAVAWILSLQAHDRALPVKMITGALTAIIAGLLMMQPDFGQTIIFGLVWLALLMTLRFRQTPCRLPPPRNSPNRSFSVNRSGRWPNGRPIRRGTIFSALPPTRYAPIVMALTRQLKRPSWQWPPRRTSGWPTPCWPPRSQPCPKPWG